jgi:hypothetical protein
MTEEILVIAGKKGKCYQVFSNINERGLGPDFSCLSALTSKDDEGEHKKRKRRDTKSTKLSVICLCAFCVPDLNLTPLA